MHELIAIDTPPARVIVRGPPDHDQRAVRRQRHLAALGCAPDGRVHAASDQDRGRCAALAEIGYDVAHAAAYFQLGPIERRIYEMTRSTAEVEALDLDLATFPLQIGY